jgi:hypothetical protein
LTIRIVFVPQIVKVSDLEKSTLKAGQTVLQQLLQFTMPAAFEVNLDRLSSVKHLRAEVLKRIPAVHLSRSNNSVLLVESDDNNLSEVSKILRDSVSVAKINEGAVIYAYCCPAELPNQIICFQVILR